MTGTKQPVKVDFRRTQAAEPAVSNKRRFGKWKNMKKSYDIYVTDIETGEETLALTVYARSSREASALGRERLRGSKLMSNIEFAAYTAVEIKS